MEPGVEDFVPNDSMELSKWPHAPDQITDVLAKLETFVMDSLSSIYDGLKSINDRMEALESKQNDLKTKMKPYIDIDDIDEPFPEIDLPVRCPSVPLMSPRRPRRKIADPDAPKRALPAFYWFCNEHRPSVVEEFPAKSVGEVAKELGRRWALLSCEEKTKYSEIERIDLARYEKEKSAYEQRFKGP